MVTLASIEPLLPESNRELEDVAIELTSAANRFAARLHPIMRASVGDLVRSMNCYYSNLIEGHNTLPIDIDRAMAGEYAREPEKRNLQLEARAHIEVQQLIDRNEMPFPVLSLEGICWMHEEFCRRLPDDLLIVRNPDTGEEIKMVPGQLRARHVKVGDHVAPEPEMIEPLIARFVEAYSFKMLSKLQKIIGAGASHHRLAWIHPFLDGNGRVSRLFSHTLLRELGIGSELWSVSRGLARNVADYKRLLAQADQPRRGDLDGRGNLTQAGLTEFTIFFLSCCFDQVTFMEELLKPEELLNRVEVWCNEEIQMQRLPKGSWPLLREAILAGEFSRSQVQALTGYQERQARTVLSSLLDCGVLTSPSPKGKVRLGFPIDIIERWLPRLYPAVR
ncbi:Fic family protein [Agrobacterium tumefaciens]|uniref:Fic family protein n=1 Tax=Agrobacterium tumefaciens TaxID=358 RepID=UPI00157339F6|nr:Fic family protein [Agrobacterium tumefaciens]NTE68084.1 Fic family protein [Agrobacterium tumefaciens]